MNPVPLFLIIVTLPLLLGGCGEKSSPEGSKSTSVNQTALSEEVKPEEPVAEAKPELEGVNEEEIEEREGIIYLNGSDTPYTGKVFMLYAKGQKKSETNVKDGKPDGLWVRWHKNGQKKSESNYKDGVEISVKYWNSKGVEGVNVEELEQREGIYYLVGSDTPYTGKATSLYENGQKWSEANFKDGKLDGLAVGWHENGQKESEVNFKDGKFHGLWTEWHKNGQKKSERNYKDGKEVEDSAKYWNSKGEPVDSREETYL